jgi:integrase
VYRQGGFQNKQLAREWEIKTLAALQRGQFGLIRMNAAERVAPLIDAYEASMTAMGRDEKHIETSINRLIRLADEAGWVTLGDVTSESLIAWRERGTQFQGQKVGQKTLAEFVAIAKTWGKWLVSHRHASTNPLADVQQAKPPARRDVRRALTIGELNRLLGAAPPMRRLGYTFLAYCSLRMRPFESMRWSWLSLDSERPTVTVPASFDKSRTGRTLPLRLDVAAQLRKLKRQTKAKSDDIVFSGLTVSALRADLKAAGIPFSAGDGSRRFDRHSFRMQQVSLLRMAGHGVEIAHVLLGHSDERTTKKHYAESATTEAVGRAVEQMPAVGTVRRAQ